jgi:large subunit ribosomal protein L23
MAIFDIFKKKKKPEKKTEKQPLKKKPVAKPQKTRSSFSGVACKVLREPHVSEKATDLTKKDWYVFRVYADANKKEIKKAIEELYGVDVVSVRVINIPRKKRRLGRIEGWRKGYKKALVRLKVGQKIEVLPR